MEVMRVAFRYVRLKIEAKGLELYDPKSVGRLFMGLRRPSWPARSVARTSPTAISTRALPKSEWDAGWMQGIQRVVLVHRLREVVALLGFTRIEPATKDISGELDIGVQRADIARDISWLPACEHRGEGVFLQFNEEALRRIPMGTPASLIKVTNSPIDPVKHSKTWSPGRKSEVKDEPN